MYVNAKMTSVETIPVIGGIPSITIKKNKIKCAPKNLKVKKNTAINCKVSDLH
jgi:hypothetical protein